MANQLEIPEDLNSLIEKREDKDRRNAESAAGPPNGEERRSGEDRRKDRED